MREKEQKKKHKKHIQAEKHILSDTRGFRKNRTPQAIVYMQKTCKVFKRKCPETCIMLQLSKMTLSFFCELEPKSGSFFSETPLEKTNLHLKVDSVLH